MFEEPAGPGLASVLAACDLSQVEGGARVDALVAAGRLVSWANAVVLEAMAAVADRSSDGFAGDEVAFSLHLTRRGAENQVALARDLRDRLPSVLAALRAGWIDLVRARVFSDLLTPVADHTAREIADRLLPLSEGWTSGQLRARLLKEILAADPNAAKERYRRSVEGRRVHLGANDDSTASLSAIFLPPQRAAAAYPTSRYPSAPMRRWIFARDGICRAPGCTHPARSCDIDHTHDHADGGPTTDDNLGLLCRHHHRLKHETDHRLDQPEPGTFRWTTPQGHTHDVTPERP